MRRSEGAFIQCGGLEVEYRLSGVARGGQGDVSFRIVLRLIDQVAVRVPSLGVEQAGDYGAVRGGCVAGVPGHLDLGLETLCDYVGEVLGEGYGGLGVVGIAGPVALVVNHIVGVGTHARVRERAVAEDGGEADGRVLQGVGINVSQTAAGLVLHSELRAQVHSQYGAGRDVYVYVRAEVEPAEVHLGVVAVVAFYVEDTVLEIVGTARVVAHVLGAAGYVHVDSARHRPVLEDGLYPVYVGVQVGIGSGEVHLPGIVVYRRVVAVLQVKGVEVVDELGGVCHTRKLRGSSKTALHLHVYLWL